MFSRFLNRVAFHSASTFRTLGTSPVGAHQVGLYNHSVRSIGRYFKGLNIEGESGIAKQQSLIDLLDEVSGQPSSSLPPEEGMKRQEVYNKLRSEGRKVRKNPNQLLAEAMNYKREKKVKDELGGADPIAFAAASRPKVKETSLDDLDLSSIDLRSSKKE